MRRFFVEGKYEVKKEEFEFKHKKLKKGEFKVKILKCGICSSDISAYLDDFKIFPKEFQGHEGLGLILEGKSEELRPGDYVSVKNNSCFSELIYCREENLKKVPGSDVAYILEPVACAYNIFIQCMNLIKSGNERVLILGSGYLSILLSKLFSQKNLNFFILDKGKNSKFFEDVPLFKFGGEKYDILIDLKKDEIYDHLLKPDSVYFMCAEKNFNFSNRNFLWNGQRIFCPSPKNKLFQFLYKSDVVLKFVERNFEFVSSLWTNSCTFETVEFLFEKFSFKRKSGDVRGYVIF